MIDFSTHEPLVAAADIPIDGVDQARVNAAAEAVRTYCGWTIAPPRTEVLTGQVGTRMVTLPTMHLTEVTGVETKTGQDLQVVDWEASGLIWLGSHPAARSVKASVTHGLAECPQAIIEVITDMVRDLTTADSGPSISSVKLDGADIDYRTPQDVGVRRRIAASYGHILDRYKL